MSIMVNKRIREGLSCSLTIQVDMGVKVHNYMHIRQISLNYKAHSVNAAIGWLLVFIQLLCMAMTNRVPL